MRKNGSGGGKLGQEEQEKEIYICEKNEDQSPGFIEAYVRDSYDLTPKGIVESLGLLDVDYNKVSAYGHFGKADMPWEQ